MAEGLVGRRLLGGEYELREILGQGGMATVYRAFSRSLDTDVAVKVLAPRLAQDAGFRERFHDEARSLAGLHHPNLVEVHHYGEEDGLVYIVMRLVPGGTLKDRLALIGGPLDLVGTARVVSQVADALQLAHDRGLVHLDIKPVNILMGRADWALLADFGITRAIGHERTAGGRQRYAGTPAYMSPEQWRGDEVDGRSDEYSLAITAYEMLTGGARPFAGQTTEALEQAHLSAVPTRPRQVNPGIPGPVEEVLLRAMAKDPANRYPRVADFAEALGRAVEATRGITLETKAAFTRLAPNLLGILLLLILGPLLVGLVPLTPMAGTGLPLRWPFQLTLSLLIALLYLGIRWPLVGLLTRGVSALLGGTSGSWRKGIAASVEGTVSLAYLFGAYWLLASWVVAIVGVLAGVEAGRVVATVLSVVVVIAALGLVVRIYRVAGPVVTAVILGAAWAMAGVLPTVDTSLGGSLSLADAVKAVVGIGILVLLLMTRSRVQAEARRWARATLFRLAAAALPEPAVDQAEARQQRLAELVGGVVDFLYLLVGDALLLYPIGRGLDQAIGSLASAVIVTALVAIPWLWLTSRLRRVAGTAGVALGVLLGAPALVSLPVLRETVIGSRWPATLATWAVGTIVLLLLAATRGQVRAIGQQVLGATLDRRLLGTAVAADENEGARRVEALGAVAGSLLDVGYLLVAYWLLGIPVVGFLARNSGQTGAGSLLLVLLLIGALALVALPVRRAILVLRGHRDPTGRSAARMVLALAIVLALATVTAGAAAPAVWAAPGVVGGLAVGSALEPVVTIGWQYLLPWTPSHGQATYVLELACSNGQEIGQFREAFVPAAGAMPHGPVGRTGPTGVSCAHWPRVYTASREAAGVPAVPSVSWDWLDVQVVLHADHSADVTETHHVLFTFGAHDHLSWSEAGNLSDLVVTDDRQAVPVNPASATDHEARLVTTNGRQLLEVRFPPVNSPAMRTITVRYHLADAVVVSGGEARFARRIVGPVRSGPVWQTTVNVRLPALIRAGAVRLSTVGTGTRDGMIDARTAWFSAADVAGDGNVTTIVAWPVATPTPLVTATPTPTLAPSATPTPVPTDTATPTPTEGARATSVMALLPSPTAPATATPLATATPRPTFTAVPTATPTFTPRPTATPTLTPTPTLRPTATASPTSTPAPPPPPPPPPTSTATRTPSATPSPTQTATATWTPTSTPTRTPVPVLVIQSLTAVPTPNPLGGFAVVVSWTSTGGVAPYAGEITASNIPPPVGTTTPTPTTPTATPTPYATALVSAPNGSWTGPAPLCGLNIYSLILHDASGQTAGKQAFLSSPC